MFKTLISIWQYVAVAFAAGLAIGYVGAVWQFEHAVLSHTDKKVAEQHTQDKKVQTAATGVSKAAQERHASGYVGATDAIKQLQNAPERLPECNLDDRTLNMLGMSGK